MCVELVATSNHSTSPPTTTIFFLVLGGCSNIAHLWHLSLVSTLPSQRKEWVCHTMPKILGLLTQMVSSHMIIDRVTIVGGVWSWKEGWLRGRSLSHVVVFFGGPLRSPNYTQFNATRYVCGNMATHSSLILICPSKCKCYHYLEVVVKSPLNVGKVWWTGTNSS